MRHAFRYASTFKRILLPVFVLTATGCQTIEDASVYNAPRSVSPVRAESRQEPQFHVPSVYASASADRPTSDPIFVEGTGDFVGHGQVSTQQKPSDDDSGQWVTINLVNVPPAQAAKTVLGDILSVRYTVDPKVEGRLTIQTPAPVSKAAAMDLFQAALRSNAAAVVNANGMYRVVPVDLAPVGAIIQTRGTTRANANLGSGLQVVQLTYVAASEMRRILEPIAPRGGIVRVDDARRTITLSGSSHEIAGMMEAVSTFDVDVMKGMSFALVPVRTSDPGTIADELKTVFASEQEGPMAGMIQFLPNKRLSAILVISPQKAYLRRAAEWVRKLDAQATGAEKQFFTYAVQNRRAQELVDVLQSMFASTSPGSPAGGGERNVAPPYQEASVRPAAGPQGIPSFGNSGRGDVTGSIFQGQGGQKNTGSGQGSTPQRASTRVATIQIGEGGGAGQPRVSIAADEAKNSILIEATHADYRRVMRVLGTLDVMPNQVMLEATIAEITLNDDLKFGLRWYLQSGNSGFTFSDAVSGAVGSVFPGFSYALRATNIAVTLNALNTITDVNVVSSPSLMVMDNRTAFLQIGDQVPITTQSSVVLGPGSPVVNSIAYKDTGIILAVTPRINESGRVLLDIEQEVSSVAPTTTSGIDSPTIRQRRVRTSVVVNNGEVLVLGGLIQDSRTLARKQVPIIGDIPYLGNLFKHKDNDLGKTELVIMISPRVVRSISEARRVTDEFRRELSISGRPGYREQQRARNAVRRLVD